MKHESTRLAVPEFCCVSRPSSPRWFLLPGSLNRGFLFAKQAAKIVFTFLCLSVLAGCQSASIDHYRTSSPSLNPAEFFDGFLTAHGIVKDYSGTVIRTFNADIHACWKDGIGTLDESFLFDDGEEQTRKWELTPNSAQRYTATAGDVVGNGDAEWAGNALFLNYVLSVALDEDTIDLSIDDRMYRVSDHVVINESKMSKFGLPVGEIVLTIIRHPSQEARCN